MAEYEFVTRWSFRAPIEKVWSRIADAERWPTWWRYVSKVEVLEPGDENGVGRVLRMTWKTRLFYSLSFDIRSIDVGPPNYMEGVATGELEGQGIWRLRQVDDVTDVRYDWHVKTTKAWMNFFAPIARPFFEWNHSGVMKAGEEGLRRLVEAPMPPTRKA
jgi:hypothetical protein